MRLGRPVSNASARSSPGGRAREIVPPIFVDPEDPFVFESVAEAEERLAPADVDPGEVAYDSTGRLLHVRVAGAVVHGEDGGDDSRARVEITPAEEEPRHREDLKRALVAWLGNTTEPTLDLSRESLESLIERARARARLLGGPSGIRLLLGFVGVVLGMLVSPLPMLGFHWLHCLGHQPLAGLRARTLAAALLMSLPLVVVSAVAGVALVTGAAWLIPPVRRVLQWDANRRNASYLDLEGRRLRLTAIVAGVGLLLALAGALLPR